MSSTDDNGSSRRGTWTLGAIKQRNLALEGYCVTKGCGHFDLIVKVSPRDDHCGDRIFNGGDIRERWGAAISNAHPHPQ